ncbi:MAG: sigma-70 family RNA polymerase sigma factor [Planctomycetaceae bacterium]
MTVAPTSDLTNYVFASVRNAALDVQRQKQRIVKSQESIFSDFVASDSAADQPPDTVLTAERDQILRDAVNELESDVREVVVLKIFAGLTFDAIGDVMELPSKTVATRYRRAILKLEERLRGQI